MSKAQDCYAAISYYEKIWKARYGRSPIVNRYSARWSFNDILGGMTLEQLKGLLDFYLKTGSEKMHSLDWFFRNYDKLITSQQESEADAARRKRLREESQKRAEQWKKEKLDKQGTTDD